MSLATESLFDEIPWDDLLLDIHAHNVLPIVGPGLVTVEKDGRHLLFTDWLAPQLAGKLKLAAEEGMTLNRAARTYLLQKGSRATIYKELAKLVELYEQLPIPPGLADLAAISDFDLFLTCTFDEFLRKALLVARPHWDDRLLENERGGRAVFTPNEAADLPATLPATFLYHVLGVWNKPGFAVWEEDHMEYLYALLATPKDNRRHLASKLLNRSLLLIGSPFDDWMVRFFLRFAKDKPLSKLRDDECGNYLADQPAHVRDPMVFYLEKGTATPQVVSMEPRVFMAELRRRWAEKYAAGFLQDALKAMPQDMVDGAIFISYSRDDAAIVAPFAAALKQGGLPVWFDADCIRIGVDYNEALQGAIKRRCSLFLSLISKNTERLDDRTVHTERLWAAAMQVPGQVYYLQVIIDDTETPQNEPPGLTQRHFIRLPGAVPTAAFIADLRRYWEEHRQKGYIKQP